EHTDGNLPFPGVALGLGDVGHGADRSGSLADDHLADAVEAGYIHYRRNESNVLIFHASGEIFSGERRDAGLRNPHWNFLQGRQHDIGSSTASHSDSSL